MRVDTAGSDDGWMDAMSGIMNVSTPLENVLEDAGPEMIERERVDERVVRLLGGWSGGWWTTSPGRFRWFWGLKVRGNEVLRGS